MSLDLIQIGVAGLLAVPALLVQVASVPLVAVLSIPSLCLLCFRKRSTNNDSNNDIQTAHAIISGGSSGIGLSIAQACVERGMARVTILARNKKKLEDAVEQLKKAGKKNTVIDYRSVDVSNASVMEETAKELCKNNNNQQKIYLFCCAGQPHPCKVEDIPSSTFAQLVQVNQLGAIYTVQAFLPHLKKNKSGGGTIVLTSSMGGQVGIFGFGAYAPTKFALRGYAESVHAELAAIPNVHIQVAFPPDTDTPGFAHEETMKPPETRLISETAGLAQPAEIATSMLNAAVASNPTFFVYFTFEGWMLSALTAGMSPVSSLVDAMAQVALMGLFRFVSLFYLNDWWRIIRNEAQKQTTTNESAATTEVKANSSKEDASTTQASEKAD